MIDSSYCGRRPFIRRPLIRRPFIRRPFVRRPFVRSDYINKFKSLTDGVITSKESKKFLNNVQNLKKLKSKDIRNLNIEVKKGNKPNKTTKKAIF